MLMKLSAMLKCFKNCHLDAGSGIDSLACELDDDVDDMVFDRRGI